MLKSRVKILRFIIPVCIIILLLSSSVVYHAIQIDSYYRKIKTEANEESFWNVWIFNGVKYHHVPGFHIQSPDDGYTETGFSLISWNWYYPFIKSEIYGDNAEDPHYIFHDPRKVRISEDYDYMNDEYVVFNYSENHKEIMDTDLSFILKDVYYSAECINRKDAGKYVAGLHARSKQLEMLRLVATIYRKDNAYYIFFDDGLTNDTYKMKPEFIELLKEAGILNIDS